MSDIEQIELSIEAAKELVALKEAALKLSKNREFKKIILEGYFEDEAQRLVSIYGDYLHKEYRGEIEDSMKGISHLRQFLQNIVRTGEMAEQELHDQRETLDELLEQDDDDEVSA